jgi:hypothetical protein
LIEAPARSVLYICLQAFFWGRLRFAVRLALQISSHIIFDNTSGQIALRLPAERKKLTRGGIPAKNCTFLSFAAYRKPDFRAL